MGQKAHPFGFRIGFNKSWSSKWFSKGKDYARNVHEDLYIKKGIMKRYSHAQITAVEIERIENLIRIIIYTARPGIIIGRGGKEREKIKEELEKYTGKEVSIDIHEINKPELVSKLVAEGIALQLEKRVAYRRVMKKAVDSALREGAKGIKVMCSGRIGGAEIARSEWYLIGRLPLQTLKADIDYGFCEAFTTYGQIGIKIWIYKGDVDKEKIVKTPQIEEELKE
ncbi:MAG: 30S ribosomal protein S3 [Acidobacteriota bacterium]